MARYTQIQRTEIPEFGIRFDVPERNQGQHVEIAYGGNIRAKHMFDEGAPYKRITDTSIGVGHPDRVSYWKLSSAPAQTECHRA